MVRDMRLLPLVLLSAPLLEIYVLVRIGGVIGGFPTLLLLVFDAVLGVQLMRSQGAFTLQRMQEAMRRGEMPGGVLMEGMMIWLAGLLLLIPGVLSDLLAVLLLLPALRRTLMQRWVRRAPRPESRPYGQHEPGRVIDGEFRREDD